MIGIRIGAHATVRYGGSDDLDNLVIACRDCNRGIGGKHARTEPISAVDSGLTVEPSRMARSRGR